MKPGDGVFLRPGSGRFKIKPKAKEEVSSIKCDDVDEDLYPEYYRKRDYVKGNNAKTPDPFQVALVKEIRKEGGEVMLRGQLCFLMPCEGDVLSSSLTWQLIQLYLSDGETMARIGSSSNSGTMLRRSSLRSL